MEVKKIKESPRAFGKNTLMKGKIIEVIVRGEEYLLYKMVDNQVHILPDKKLKEIKKETQNNTLDLAIKEIKKLRVLAMSAEDEEIAERVNNFFEAGKEQLITYLTKLKNI